MHLLLVEAQPLLWSSELLCVPANTLVDLHGSPELHVWGATKAAIAEKLRKGIPCSTPLEKCKKKPGELNISGAFSRKRNQRLQRLMSLSAVHFIPVLRCTRCSSHIYKKEERRQVLHRYFWSFALELWTDKNWIDRFTCCKNTVNVLFLDIYIIYGFGSAFPRSQLIWSSLARPPVKVSNLRTAWPTYALLPLPHVN